MKKKTFTFKRVTQVFHQWSPTVTSENPVQIMVKAVTQQQALNAAKKLSAHSPLKGNESYVFTLTKVE